MDDTTRKITDGEALQHLIKSAIGSGILAMPVAFSYVGLVGGVLITVCASILCTHCTYLVVKSASELCTRTGKATMTYAEVVEVAFADGPDWSKRLAKFVVLYILFLAYFGSCSVYSVIVASTIEQVFEHYTAQDVDIRFYLLALMLPFILLSWIPDLKWLAPISLLANISMGTGLGLTMYYLVTEIPEITNDMLLGSVELVPSFIAIVVFAVQAIGVAMPLHNQMQEPENFLRPFGVLQKGMAIVAMIYGVMGFFGYLKYGDGTADSITLNLPKDEGPAIIVKLLVAFSVFCTFGIQFYVCLEIAWRAIEGPTLKNPMLANYGLRTGMVIVIMMLAVLVPSIAPFISLIGACCCSTLGLILPVLLETVIFWTADKHLWMVTKNIAIGLVGILALIFGTKNSLGAIIALYR